jgi:DNA-binding CsgD family transcriptional regulator
MAKGGPATIDDLLRQAKTTNRLLAAQLKAQMSQMEVIGLLTDSGLTAREVGEILGTSAATVAVTQQRLRNKKKKKPED